MAVCLRIARLPRACPYLSTRRWGRPPHTPPHLSSMYNLSRRVYSSPIALLFTTHTLLSPPRYLYSVVAFIHTGSRIPRDGRTSANGNTKLHTHTPLLPRHLPPCMRAFARGVLFSTHVVCHRTCQAAFISACFQPLAPPVYTAASTTTTQRERLHHTYTRSSWANYFLCLRALSLPAIFFAFLLLLLTLLNLLRMLSLSLFP